MKARPVVLDTNVFVAAGFRPDSASGRILEAVRAGELRMIWSDATRRETQSIVDRIPPLQPDVLEGLFRPEDRYADALGVAHLTAVADPDDRKFASLAKASGATLITSDDHLLSAAASGRFDAVTPGAFWRDFSGR